MKNLGSFLFLTVFSCLVSCDQEQMSTTPFAEATLIHYETFEAQGCCEIDQTMDMDTCALYQFGWNHGYADGYEDAAEWFLNGFQHFIDQQPKKVRKDCKEYFLNNLDPNGSSSNPHSVWDHNG